MSDVRTTGDTAHILKTRIITAVKNVDAPMLTRVCDKNLNIVLMWAIITRGARIGHL
jgi:hypothetical protein